MKFISLFFTLLASPFFFAQSIISGRVTDENGQPISKAYISIQLSYDGAVTDDNGLFKFETSTTGQQQLEISAFDFEINILSIDIENLSPFIISLEPTLKLKEVVIKAGNLAAGDTNQSAVLNALDIVTTAGSAGDIIAALQKLPGTQQAGESGRLLVRGGDEFETQTFVNGIIVSKPYTSSANNTPARGRFSPFLFKGMSFSTGGYSAEYGNALSSVLVMETNQQLNEKKSEISVLSVGATLAQTLRGKNNSLSIIGSYQNLYPYYQLIPQKAHWIKPYEAFSGEMVYKQKLSKGFLSLYSAYSSENFSLDELKADLSPVQVKQQTDNFYTNLHLTTKLSKQFNLNVGQSISYNQQETIYGSFQIPNREVNTHSKVNLGYRWSSRVKLNVGSEFFHTFFKEDFTDETNRYTSKYTSNLWANFLEIQWSISPKLSTIIGVRSTNNNLQKAMIIDPRFSIGYSVNSTNQFSFAYGIFHQQPSQNYLKFEKELDWMQAQHLILNYTYEKRGRMLRMEIYHKKYNQLVSYSTLNPSFHSQFNNLGNGKARGFDLFWRDNESIKKLQYWLSYSYIDSKRQDKNYPTAVQPSYIAKHTLSFVTKYWINDLKSQVGFTNTFSSGRPYNNPNEETFMNGRTKSFNDLSFAWSYLISQQKIIYFSVNNLLGTRQVYGYQYANNLSSEGKFEAKPIQPMAKRFFIIGFFWTISQNKKDNYLDNL